MPELAGTVAVVGFPNVGKSTLVNRLTGTRAAVVHETPGVTRDRKELVCEWAGTEFRLIDTGGVDVADRSPITRSIADQARAAVDEADLVLFVVDAKAGITPGDEEVAEILRRPASRSSCSRTRSTTRPGTRTRWSSIGLGLGDPIPLSALHGHGTGDLLDAVVARLPGAGPSQVGEEAIRVAILGRPNVGKSSLLNAILGEERVIVSDVPGTTRDAIDTLLERDGRVSSWSTPPASGGSAVSGRGSITTPSCARSTPRTAPMSRSSSSTRARGSSTRTSPSQTSPARRTARRSSSLSKWDIGQTKVEDVRPRVEHRLRQRPPGS